MNPSKFSSVLIAAVLVSGLAFAGEGARAASPMLPKQFAGWQILGSAQTSKDAAVADPVNAALLKEYGFTGFESATYIRDDGRKLTVKAARFADASGAYGAFTYYKMAPMLAEKIGDQGASLNERVLFYRGDILVDAVFGKLTAMSAAELRELAGVLPASTGGAGKPPALPDYLPVRSRVNNSIKYVVGPIGLEKTRAPLPAHAVDFNTGAEVALGTYTTSAGTATLMLISYPTPQIAAEHLRRIDASHQASTTPGSALLMEIGPIFSKRTGPIVVVAAGPLSQSEAKSFLASVNYDADVTWNESTSLSQKDNLGLLLVNIILLSGILVGLALVAGVAFGGVRILLKRILPDKVFDRPEHMEFISLRLSETAREGTDSKVSSSIKAV
jgi:hypothetical protein